MRPACFRFERAGRTFYNTRKLCLDLCCIAKTQIHSRYFTSEFGLQMSRASSSPTSRPGTVFVFGRTKLSDTETLPGLLDALSVESLLQTPTPILEKHCATKSDVVVRVRRVVVIAVRHAEVVPIVVVPVAAANNASISATSLVTQRHVFTNDTS